jgi:hypothetical protein
MAIILKANKVNLCVSSALFVFWYHSQNFLDTPHICDVSRLRVKFGVESLHEMHCSSYEYSEIDTIIATVYSELNSVFCCILEYFGPILTKFGT